MRVHSPAIIALLRLEWSGVNETGEPSCPECRAPLYNSNGTYGVHLSHCMLDHALRTQEDLQTPMAREIARCESYQTTQRRQH